MKNIDQSAGAQGSSSHSISNAGSLTWLDKQAIRFEKARFGWMAILLTAQSCLGSIACGFILKNDASMIALSICAAVTMGCNALFIALAPPKVCLISVYLSAIINTVFILFNL